MLMKTVILTQTATHVIRQSGKGVKRFSSFHPLLETAEADENPQSLQELENAKFVNEVIQNHIGPDNETRP